MFEHCAISSHIQTIPLALNLNHWYKKNILIIALSLISLEQIAGIFFECPIILLVVYENQKIVIHNVWHYYLQPPLPLVKHYIDYMSLCIPQSIALFHH